MYKNVLWTLLLMLSLPLCVAAFTVPAYQGSYIADQADIFTESEEQQLVSVVDAIEDETSAEVVVVTITTLDGYPIEDAALEIGREWGVGKSETDNGLVMLIAVEDRQWFMATGYGLEGVLPDVLVNRIGERNFLWHFRRGEYGVGVLYALHDIKGFLGGDETIVESYELPTIEHQAVDIAHEVLAVFLLLGGIFAAIFSFIYRVTSKRKMAGVFSILLFGLITAAAIVYVPLTGDLIGFLGIHTFFWVFFHGFMYSVHKHGGGIKFSNSGGGSGSSRSSSRRSSSRSSSSSRSTGGGSFGGGGSGGRW